MNSTVGPSFKEKFTKICIYGFREQCMRATQKTWPIHKHKCVLYPN